MSKPKRTTLRNKADRLFSIYIRLRDGRCMDCLKGAGAVRLQCAHIQGRRYFGTRWDPENAICLCEGCHKKWTHDPLGWIDFVGEERFFELKRRAQAIHPRPDYERIIEELEALIAPLQPA